MVSSGGGFASSDGPASIVDPSFSRCGWGAGLLPLIAWRLVAEAWPGWTNPQVALPFLIMQIEGRGFLEVLFAWCPVAEIGPVWAARQIAFSVPYFASCGAWFS